jgi:hypothetical protein
LNEVWKDAYKLRTKRDMEAVVAYFGVYSGIRLKEAEEKTVKSKLRELVVGRD